MRKQPKSFIVEVKRRRGSTTSAATKSGWLLRSVQKLAGDRPLRSGDVKPA